MKEKIERLTSKVERQIDQGRTQLEIAQTLQVSVGTVNNDLSYLRDQAKYKIGEYIDEKLPHEYEKCLVGLNLIQREAWNTAQNTQDPREKIHALSLAKDCYAMKLDLLTNATVVDDAIRFVSKHDKPTTSISSKTGMTAAEKKSTTNALETQEADDLQQPSNISTTTTNQVF